MANSVTSARIIQKIVHQVEQYLGDVVENPEDEADVREQAWTLAVDAAQSLSLDDPAAWAKLAMKQMGYTTEARKRKMPSMIQPIPVLGAGKFKKKKVRESELNRLVSALLEDEPGGFDVAAIEGYFSAADEGAKFLSYRPQPNGDRVQTEYARSDGSIPIAVSRIANGKHVTISYHPDGVRYAKGGEADAIASVTQWASPEGEMGPTNDYSQIGDSEYFTDLASAVAKANEWLNSPLSGEEDVTPVLGGQAGPRMKLSQHRKLARPGWRK